MVLITILIVLVVQRFANIANWFKTEWFETYLGWLRPALAKSPPWLALAVVLLPVFVVLGILDLLLSLHLFGLFYLVLATAVLLLCMDARNLKNQLTAYFGHAEKKDIEAASNAVASFLNDTNATTNATTPTTTMPQSLPQTFPELYRSVTKSILTKSYTQVFALLFWFAVLGVYGASGYAILTLLRRTAVKVDGSFGDIARNAEITQNIMDWLPVRVIGVCYALVGHFVHAFKCVLKNLKLGLQDNQKFTVESGLTSLGANIEDTSTASLEENSNALALIDRALIAWIIVVALVTLGMLL